MRGATWTTPSRRCAYPPNAKNPATGQNYPPDQWYNRYAFTSRHPGGAQFAMSDGSVQFIGDTISLPVFRLWGPERWAKLSRSLTPERFSARWSAKGDRRIYSKLRRFTSLKHLILPGICACPLSSPTLFPPSVLYAACAGKLYCTRREVADVGVPASAGIQAKEPPKGGLQRRVSNSGQYKIARLGQPGDAFGGSP